MAFKICLFVTLISSLVLFAHAADVKEEDDVLVLDRTNFKDVVNEKDTLLVEFYAPWCGHCKELEPKYAAAAKQLKAKNIALAKVDATKEPGLASDFGIEGYPTLKIFKKAFPGDSFDYEGPRDTEGIVKFMENAAQSSWKPPFQLSGLHPLTSANLSEALDKQSAWLVGFIESESQRAPLMEAANQLKHGRQRKAVGFVDVSEAAGRELAEKYSVSLKQLPAFAVLALGQKSAIPFGHELNPDNLVKFYRAHSSDQSAPVIFTKLSQIDAVGDGVESLLLGHFDESSEEASFLRNFLLESGFLTERRIEGGSVSAELAKQLGLAINVIYARKPSKLLASGEQQLTPYTASLKANELKAFFDSASLPLVGFYNFDSKSLYRKAAKPVCLFLLTVSFRGEMQSSTAMWHARIAKAVAQFRGKVLFAMADDEQEEDEVKAFGLDDSSSDVNVACYDEAKRRYALSEMDSFEAEEVQSFVQQLLAGKLKPVIRSVTARSSAAAGSVLELTGNTFDKLILKDTKRHSIVLQCDLSLQPCQQSLKEFTEAADSSEMQQFAVQFAKLDTKFNDAPADYFYRYNPTDAEMAQPQVLLAIIGEKDKPVRFDKQAVTKEYILQFVKNHVKPVKSEL